nr:MAG TPA: hypothetical protein [Caudoviricetes sp.]
MRNMAAPKYFTKADRVVSHRVSSSPSMSIPSNPKRMASPSKPAPLKIGTGCASCRKRRG